jgi:hypothetical protein
MKFRVRPLWKKKNVYEFQTMHAAEGEHVSRAEGYATQAILGSIVSY